MNVTVSPWLFFVAFFILSGASGCLFSSSTWMAEASEAGLLMLNMCSILTSQTVSQSSLVGAGRARDPGRTPRRRSHQNPRAVRAAAPPRPPPAMAFRSHNFNVWHLLAEPTHRATLSLVEATEMEELARLEEEQRAQLAAIRDAPAPTPIGVKPRADDDDDATATDDHDEEVEGSRDDEDEEEEEEEEYEDDLGLDDVSEA